MRGLSSRSFFARWHSLYAASNPGQVKDRWETKGVDWVKTRHSYWGDTFSFQAEIHTLERRRGTTLEWRLMVVIERWWGADRQKAIHETQWFRMLHGPPARALSWLKLNTSL